jgi:CheY-like chemotaxis protein
MKILLVEDDDNKRTQIETFVRASFPATSLQLARSVRSGLNALLSGTYDLVLMDMTMPTFDVGIDEDGGRPQAYAGRELLRQMDRRGITTPVVVITGYDTFGGDAEVLTLSQLDAQLRSSHPVTYAGSVYYDASVAGWQEALGSIIGGW